MPRIQDNRTLTALSELFARPAVSGDTASALYEQFAQPIADRRAEQQALRQEQAFALQQALMENAPTEQPEMGLGDEDASAVGEFLSQARLGISPMQFAAGRVAGGVPQPVPGARAISTDQVVAEIAQLFRDQGYSPAEIAAAEAQVRNAYRN